MLERCLHEAGEDLVLPLQERQTNLFVAWLLQKNLAEGTLQTYLSGIRTLHLTKGFDPPNFRKPQLQHVLTGKKNQENIEKRTGNKKIRLPMTLNSMKLLKKKIISSNLNNTDKACYWATCTIALSGGFRIHEILCRSPLSFDPNFNLLHSEIELDGSTLRIKIKSEKTNKSHKATMIDLYETNSGNCPIRAYQKYLRLASYLEDDLPAFRTSNGNALTGRQLNKFLNEELNPHFNSTNGSFSSHSFRIGLCSILGHNGLNDEQLKAAGRWSSSAFERYVKMTRTKRINLAKEISNIL